MESTGREPIKENDILDISERPSIKEKEKLDIPEKPPIEKKEITSQEKVEEEKKDEKIDGNLMFKKRLISILKL